jgi:hypothetical protein
MLAYRRSQVIREVLPPSQKQKRYLKRRAAAAAAAGQSGASIEHQVGLVRAQPGADGKLGSFVNVGAEDEHVRRYRLLNRPFEMVR